MKKIVHLPKDCGNSPRKVWLSNLYAAFANADILCPLLPQELEWQCIGIAEGTSKEMFLKTVYEQLYQRATEVKIETILTHGKEACVAGSVLTEENQNYSFCDLFTFKSAGSDQVKKIRSFILPETSK